MLSDLTIEITQKCPNHCLHCSSFSSPECSRFIPLSMVNAILEEGKAMGLVQVCFSGGEPATHPQIKEILVKSRQLEIKSTVYTSGIHQCGNGQEEMDFSNLSCLPDKLIYTLFSNDSKVHDSVTQNPGSHELTMKSIAKSLAAEIPVEIHMVPMLLNVLDIEKAVNHFLEMGIPRLSILRMVPQGRAVENWGQICLRGNKLEKMNGIIGILKGRWGERLRLGAPFFGLAGNRTKCGAGTNKLLVRYDGIVLPCEAFKSHQASQFFLGSVEDPDFSLAKCFNKAIHSNLPRRSYEEPCPAQAFYADTSRGISDKY